MSNPPRKRVVLLLTLLLSPVGRFSDAAEGKLRELRANFGTQLVRLANKCDELDLANEAAITRSWLVERASDRQYLYIDDDVAPTLPSEDAPQLVQFWHRKFLQLRSEYAEALFGLARETSDRGEGTLACQLLYEALHHDSSHREARRVLDLGSPVSDRIRRRTGTRNHVDFGWRRGQYWLIESQHYRITTNASADAGVDLAKKLERFHSAWQQVFFRYWSADESLAERFRGGSTRLGTHRKLAVVLFADRDEYVNQLLRFEPQIAMSLGYYMKGEQTAFFYAGDASVEPTWYHEATHQLFQELGNAVTDVGEVSNFWIIEGIAAYMESFVARDGYVTLGGIDAERLQYARVRALTGEFYLPLSELVRLGREDLQRHEDIRRIYTQAAGLTHFLMDGANRTHRRALVDFITMLYLGRAGTNALASLCGVELEALDKQYVEFLGVQDEDLVHLNPPAVLKNLALGRTEITDAGLEHLANQTSLQWLDASFTSITDVGIVHLANAADLRRLSLEGTAITDKALEVVAHFSRLEELDLSGTNVTDTGAAQLSKLKHLKSLWLTGTQVSDDCLDALEALEHLELLEVSQTNVTGEAFAALKTKLPQLARE